MPVTIGSNILALKASAALNRNGNAIERLMQGLASGSRLNRPSDDAAGLAISANLHVGSRVFGQGVRNVNDGISALNIVDGALGSLNTVLTRQQELATQSANGSLSNAQRRALQREADALTAEFNRIVGTTHFNGLDLLSGNLTSMQIQGGFGSNGSLNVNLSGGLSRTVGNGSFTQGETYTLDSTGAEISTGGQMLGDFNGDGKLDLLSLTGTTASFGQAAMRLQLGNGDGTFGSATDVLTFPIDTQVEFYNYVVNDFNSDGRADIAFTYNDFDANEGILMVGFGLANGTFSYTSQYLGTPVTAANFQVTAGDFDQDGDMDLAATDENSMLKLYRNNGNSTFSSINHGITTFIATLAAGDFNGDGKTDLAAAFSGSLRTLTGTGNMGFSVGASTFVGFAPTNFEVADINRDGYDDLLSSQAFANVFYRGSASGISTTNTVALGTLANGGNPQIVDLNSDGNLDVVSNSRVFYGDGNFNFTVQNLGIPSTWDYSFGDIDGNGTLDYVYGDGDDTMPRTVSVRLQNGSSSTSEMYIDISTQLKARTSLSYLNSMRERLSQTVGTLGAGQSRLLSFLSTLSDRALRYSEANERIRSIDIAEASSELLRRTILQQAASSVLAQANVQPSLALSLLRN